jgi:hypothetical protein
MRQESTKRNPNGKVKGATVNRELECLKCILDLAVKRNYIPENPASDGKALQRVPRKTCAEDALSRRGATHFGRCATASSRGHHPANSDWSMVRNCLPVGGSRWLVVVLA